MANVRLYQSNRNFDVYDLNVAGNIISVTVTANAAVVKRWLSDIHDFGLHPHELIVGLGVQSTPVPGASGTPPADTLILCVHNRCLIFRLSRADGIPKKLRDLLRSPSHTFVGIWNSSDREKLKNSMHVLEMERDPMDLRLHFPNLEEATVDEIISACTGFQVEQNRELRESNWNENSLSLEQIGYAGVDAYCAFVIANGMDNMDDDDDDDDE